MKKLFSKNCKKVKKKENLQEIGQNFEKCKRHMREYLRDIKNTKTNQ